MYTYRLVHMWYDEVTSVDSGEYRFRDGRVLFVCLPTLTHLV